MRKYLFPQGFPFYKANLHCHSTASDGDFTPQELKEAYKAKGYSVIAYTDHEVMVPHPELNDPDFLALHGYEIEIMSDYPLNSSFKYRQTCHLCLIATQPDLRQVYWTNVYVTKMLREKHPELPFIMVTKPDYRPINAKRRSIVMESYQKALAAGDKNVYFLDGAAFFTGVERDACTFDGVHPNDLGLYRMAEGMVHVLRRILYGGGLY